MKNSFFIKTSEYFMVFIFLCLPSYMFSQEPLFSKLNIFPFQHEHTHGSTIVELQNGDLLAAWFQGSGERWADDVRIKGSRKKQGSENWSPPFIMADVKGFPDINPVLFIDGKDRLWLMWYTVIANQWSTSLINFRISEEYMEMDKSPVWDWQENLIVKPGGKTERGILPDDRFVASVNRQSAEYAEYLESVTDKQVSEHWKNRSERIMSLAAGEDMVRDGSTRDEQRGYPYYRRMGWQTRSKPIITGSSRMIIPLYSDGLGIALMAITDDWGENWLFSEPLVGYVEQPAIATTGSGKLVTYMRYHGPPPRRLKISQSEDEGESWSLPEYTQFPNPGSAADIVTLNDGSWVLIYNDTETGRHRLTVSLSEDEGKTWPWTRLIENGEPGEISAHYPAIIAGENNIMHATYSFFKNNEAFKNIIYVKFNKEWIKDE